MQSLNPPIMSADKGQPGRLVGAAILCGLLSCGGLALADEAEVPDLEFLEYLGSWDDSDEDWVIFAAGTDEKKASEDRESDEGSNPAPDGEKLAELEDDN